jgi:Tfp pilus assembly protein PilV
MSVRSRLPTAAQGGFSLAETLIALFILNVALLLGMILALQQPRVIRRLDAQREAVRAMENTVESLRAGLIPLQSEELSGFAAAAGSRMPAGFRVEVEVVPAALPDLYEVRLQAHFLVFGLPRERRLATMIWRPSP